MSSLSSESRSGLSEHSFAMYLIISLAVLATTAQARGWPLSCADYCSALQTNQRETLSHRRDCECLYENKNAKKQRINRGYVMEIVPVVQESSIYYEPSEASTYESVSFAKTPFHIVNPVYKKLNENTRNQKLKTSNNRQENKLTRSVVNSKHQGAEDSNHKISIEADKATLYLDIDVHKNHNNERSSGISELDDFQSPISENDLTECIDLHILVLLRNSGADKHSLEIWDEEKSKKYDHISDSDLMIEIQKKCNHPENILKDSLQAITNSSPKKSRFISEQENLHNKFIFGKNSVNSKEEKNRVDAIEDSESVIKPNISDLRVGTESVIDIIQTQSYSKPPKFREKINNKFYSEETTVTHINKLSSALPVSINSEESSNTLNQFRLFTEPAVSISLGLSNNEENDLVISPTSETTLTDIAKETLLYDFTTQEPNSINNINHSSDTTSSPTLINTEITTKAQFPPSIRENIASQFYIHHTASGSNNENGMVTHHPNKFNNTNSGIESLLNLTEQNFALSTPFNSINENISSNSPTNTNLFPNTFDGISIIMNANNISNNVHIEKGFSGKNHLPQYSTELKRHSTENNETFTNQIPVKVYTVKPIDIEEKSITSISPDNRYYGKHNVYVPTIDLNSNISQSPKKIFKTEETPLPLEDTRENDGYSRSVSYDLTPENYITEIVKNSYPPARINKYASAVMNKDAGVSFSNLRANLTSEDTSTEILPYSTSSSTKDETDLLSTARGLLTNVDDKITTQKFITESVMYSNTVTEAPTVFLSKNADQYSLIVDDKHAIEPITTESLTKANPVFNTKTTTVLSKDKGPIVRDSVENYTTTSEPTLHAATNTEAQSLLIRKGKAHMFSDIDDMAVENFTLKNELNSVPNTSNEAVTTSIFLSKGGGGEWSTVRNIHDGNFTTESANNNKPINVLLRKDVERRTEYPEEEIKIAKIMTKELNNDSVISIINGTEAIPNNDFQEDLAHSGSSTDEIVLSGRTESYDTSSKLQFISSSNTQLPSAQDDALFSAKSQNIIGKLYFLFGDKQVPARFVQDSEGQIRVGLDGPNLCNKVLNGSVLMAAICKCAQSENCINSNLSEFS